MALRRVVDVVIGLCYNKLMGSLERNKMMEGGSGQHENVRNYTRE
jgi:hypothetical protein